MSYTTLIRNALAGLVIEVPEELLQSLDQLDRLVDSARDVVLSADNAGCDGELTVCDGNHVQSLKLAVNQVIDLQMNSVVRQLVKRQAADQAIPTQEVLTERLKAIQGITDRLDSVTSELKKLVPPGSDEVVLELNGRDADGCVTGLSAVMVTTTGLGNLVDVAVDLVLANRKQQPTDEALQALDEMLTETNILSGVVPAPAKVVPAGYVKILVQVHTSQGIPDAFLESATDYETDQPLLVNFERLYGCKALELNGVTPNQAKFGVREYAESIDGANKLAKALGLYGQVESLNLEPAGDFSEEIEFCVLVPETAVYRCSIGEAKSYIARHWVTDFESQSTSGKRLSINRFVNEMHGFNS
ncbi:hypothetical protein ACRCPS_18245 [Pseudomonas aeruginosa]